MKESLRNRLSAAAPTLWNFRALFFGRSSYLNVTGWRESIRRGYPCRPDGSELPWMNYSIIRFLEDRLSSDLTLFEFGSGYSTIFYSKLVKSVVSIEYDRSWQELLSSRVGRNVEIHFCEADIDGEYCRKINGAGTFDVVVIDGRDRVNCVKQSLSSLSDRGVILLDDSMRERYAPAFEVLGNAGFSVLDFEGIKPTDFELHRSSLFYRAGNCVGI